MRQIVLDIITALTGIAVAGLILHNPNGVSTVTNAALGDYSTALATAGKTK